jgi:hypothetical protein
VAKKVYYGPVYFRRESEPYMTLALAGARRRISSSSNGETRPATLEGAEYLIEHLPRLARELRWRSTDAVPHTRQGGRQTIL